MLGIHTYMLGVLKHTYVLKVFKNTYTLGASSFHTRFDIFPEFTASSGDLF